MDRFFSKLDLRDIKIKPEGNRFLPTDDENELEAETEAPSDAPASATAELDADVQDDADVDAARPDEPAEFAENDPVATINGNRDTRVSSSGQLTIDDVEYGNGEVLKVSAKSRPSAVAGAIAGVVRDSGRAEVQAIGAGATNQAVKAVAIARDYLLESGIEAVCLPAFIDVVIDNEERTAIRLVVETR
jgi:stage V sporulation protein S